MALAWIAVDTNIEGKPEIGQIARSLGLDRAYAVGLCMRVWAWADAQTEDGAIDGVTLDDVDYHARHPGIASAMQDAGWLECDDAGIVFPNYTRFNSQSTKARLLDAERKRLKRAEK